MTKKQKKLENNKRRNFWEINPRTKVKDSAKKYSRKKFKKISPKNWE